MTPKRIQFTACINALLILIVAGWLPARCQIQEEVLPQVTTLTEVQRRIEMIADTVAEADLTVTTADLDDLSRELDRQESTLAPDQAEQLNNVRMKLEMVRGALNYYHRRKTAAGKIFRRLLRDKPDAMLDGDIATSNLAKFFERIRDKIIGTLTVKVDPEGSEILIGEKLLGKAPLYASYLLKGNYTLEIRHEGYASRTIDANIRPGKETTIEAALEKNSGSCLVVTSPAGVTVSVDGEKMGTTSGTLSADFQDQIDTSGVDPATLSAPLMLEFIPVGKHRVTFSKPCFRSMEFNITIGIDQFYFPPIQLEPSYGRLEVFSAPTGARVTLADEFAGTTPLTLDHACPGEWPIRVDMGTRSPWMGTVIVKENETTTVHASPRPSVLFLGCASPDESLISGGDHRIRDWLAKSGKFSLVSREETDTFRYRPLVARLFEDLGELTHQDRIRWQSILETLTLSLSDSHAALYAIAFLNPEDSYQPGALFFIHPENAFPDRLELPPGLPPEVPPVRIIQALNRPWTVSGLWLGLKMVDSRDGLRIIEIDNDGPAVFSVFKPGDILAAVNGKAVTTLEQYRDIMLNPATPRNLAVDVRRGSRTLTSSLEARRIPIMIPLSDPGTLYNDILACLQEMTVFAETRDAVYLNIGICHLALGRPDLALTEGFLKCSLPPGPGVSAGTLAYLKALAFHRSGASDKVQPLLDIAGRSEATFIDPDGPPVSPLAKAGIR